MYRNQESYHHHDIGVQIPNLSLLLSTNMTSYSSLANTEILRLSLPIGLNLVVAL